MLYNRLLGVDKNPVEHNNVKNIVQINIECPNNVDILTAFIIGNCFVRGLLSIDFCGTIGGGACIIV